MCWESITYSSYHVQVLYELRSFRPATIPEYMVSAISMPAANSRRTLDELSWTCKGCLLQRDLYCTSNLGPVYTKLSAHRVFARISMDLLMPISVLPWPGAKTAVKKIPVIVKCLTWGCIYLTVAESQATDQMLLVLFKA